MADFLVSGGNKISRSPRTMTRFNLDGSVFVFLQGRERPTMFLGVLAEVWKSLDEPTPMSRLLSRFKENSDEVEDGVLQMIQLQLVTLEKSPR